MKKQYLDIKKKFPGEILFYPHGGFFTRCSSRRAHRLENPPTSRSPPVRTTCHVRCPAHAAEAYIARLIKAGHRVAICEQMETVPSSGTVVRREVTRVITPGTLVEQNLLQSDAKQLPGLDRGGSGEDSLRLVDISTGDFFLSSMARSIDMFRGELARFSPREAIYHGVEDAGDRVIKYLKNQGIPVNKINEWLYDGDYLASTIAEAFQLAASRGSG